MASNMSPLVDHDGNAPISELRALSNFTPYRDDTSKYQKDKLFKKPWQNGNIEPLKISCEPIKRQSI